MRTSRVLSSFLVLASAASGLAALQSTPSSAAPAVSWTNPVSATPLHDPAVVREGSDYYMFGSFMLAAAGGTNAGAAVNVPVMRSGDLASWRFHGDALPVTRLGSWVDASRVSDIGGPAVVAGTAGYVLYYSAVDRVSGVLCIGAATSSAVVGPYTGQPTPLACDAAKGNAVTPTVYAASGASELVWVFENGTASDQIVARRLSTDGLSFASSSTTKTLLTAERAAATWERGQLDNPSIVPGSNPPVLMYSAGNRTAFTYGINWSTCSTSSATGELTACTRGQMGPWSWYQSRTTVTAPGAADFFADASGAVWMAYTAVSGSACIPDCLKAATPRLDKLCLDVSNVGVQPRTTAPSAGGALARVAGDCAADVVTPAESWVAADGMFRKDPQWRGGDGAHSIPIGGNKVLWTFGDSFIDVQPYSPNASVEWSRIGSHFIRNSVAVQTGTDPADPATTFKGYWLGGTSPSDFFAGTATDRWIWDVGGVMVGNRLLVWTGERGGAGLGVYEQEIVVHVDDPAATEPDQWVQNQAFPPSPAAHFGFWPEPVSVYQEGGYVYVFYTGGGPAGCSAPAGVRLARFSEADLAAGTFTNRHWWDGSGYRPASTFTPCDGAPPVIPKMSMAAGGAGGAIVKDASGQYDEYAGAAFYGGLLVQSAPAPTGPWPGARNVLTAPESTWESAETYIWVPHPHLTGVPAGTMWTTWNSNGASVFTNERLYYPRFAKTAAP